MQKLNTVHKFAGILIALKNQISGILLSGITKSGILLNVVMVYTLLLINKIAKLLKKRVVVPAVINVRVIDIPEIKFSGFEH